MNKFKFYRKKTKQLMRPHIVGEDLTEISVSPEDKTAILFPGGMIAVNSENEKDQWYVNKEFFEKNYELALCENFNYL